MHSTTASPQTTVTTSAFGMPLLGMGTFRLKDQVAYDAVQLALAAGYRHIDTAQIYGNEADVGRAISASGLARADIFLTSKIWLENLTADKFLPSLAQSLQDLQTDYLDLLLIHWPPAADGVPMRTYLAELASAKAQGLVRHIGVSNFTIAQLQQAIGILGAGAIVTNQVEVHPYLQNRRLLAFMQQQQILPTAYMPLAVGKVLQEPLLQDMAARTGYSIPQLVLRWLLDKGMATIPMSTREANLCANLQALHISLAPADQALIDSLDRLERIANPDFAPDWD